MKRLSFLNGSAIVALMMGAPLVPAPFAVTPAQAQGAQGATRTTAAQTATVSIEQFRETLAPLGEHVQIQGLGEAWRPRDVAADWQPYSVGRWIFNDKVGWYFESDEPWAEITFHYGRWYDDPDHGWVWIAGTQWAPAWVEWRRSRQFVGWRPLPPDNAPRRAAATSRNHRGGPTEILEQEWVFVPTERIVAEDIHTVRVEPTRVVEIYEETRPIGRVERRGAIAVNFAIRPEILQREDRITVRSQNLPQAMTAPVPREIQSIATETRATARTGTPGTASQPAGQAAETPARAPNAPNPPATAETPNRAAPTGAAGTPEIGQATTRQTQTTPSNATQNPNRANAQHRSGPPAAGASAESSRPTLGQQRRPQPQQAGAPHPNQGASQSSRRATPPPAGAAPTERAQQHRPAGAETTGSVPTRAGQPPQPRNAPATGSGNQNQASPALRQRPNAPDLDRRSEGAGQPAPSAQSGMRQEHRGGPAASDRGHAPEATGSTGGRPPRRPLPPGAAPQQ